MDSSDAPIPKYSELVYNGFWFSPEREALQALVTESQRDITGLVRLKLYKGNIIVAGRKSPKSLYQYELATYDKGDTFDHDAAIGFINVWGLPLQTQTRIQMLPESQSAPMLDAARIEE